MGITEVTVSTLREHLVQRHVNLELHHPAIDEAEGVATFYLWNLSGQLIGYQHYRPAGIKRPGNDPKLGRYYTYRRQPTVAVWGTESLHLTPHHLFITEGIFDAARLTERGYSAVAVLTNNPTPDLKNWLMMLNRRTTAVCDRDTAGRKLAAFAASAVFTVDKDLGDSTDEFVSELINGLDK